MQRLLGVIVLAAAVPAAVSAQSVGNAALVACSAKVSDAERLACYDGLVRGISSEARGVAEKREADRKAQAALAAAEAEKARAAAAAQAEAAKRDSFGKAQTDEERIDELPVAINEVMRDKLGRAVFLLDNGQMWRQTEAYPLPPLREGVKATLKRGTLGSYRIKIEGNNRNITVIRMR